ncbi:lipid A biosynthesis acyltransferase [Rubrivivax gelatinosus]|uniref:Lipid A biosynthesis acyltransferase n=1 Tax=Rubrivivax gelatinosus TaxID=28068 RepID=A0ABS1DTK4_RUBGE|nr:lipid A biosynthesis acyltransferase [Rubrivivax gelatinosus]MBK1612975.1 lipid A biosynthesis acyltransferase [Rubrivivax gelatinosus]MBK1712823.1 lipid A biosynthesis acyltransferase [Rubrivivax gelatinosus]
MNAAARVVLALVWLLHWLPLGVQAALGQGLGALFYRFAGPRRRIALRNLELCFPEMPLAERERIAREHFGWLGRSLIERGLLWYASPERLKRLIQVEGQVHLADESERPVMWLVPHFMALDVAGAATQLFQKRWVASIYQRQSIPAFDAAMRAGRLRFKQGEVFSRHESVLPLIRAIKRGAAFFNLPDMDFGRREAVFVPFFGVPAATLMAPAKMAASLKMIVQPVVAEFLPGGAGYRVRFLPAFTDWPSGDPEADARRMNEWIESEILRNPAQYLWVHKRFKTRPPGEPKLYAKR